MDICHSPESGTPGAPLRLKSSTPRSGFVQHTTMHDQKLTKCPRCGAPFELGFSAKACRLSFIPASKFRSFAFVDEDLNKRTWLQKLFFSPAHYCHSYLDRKSTRLNS